MIRKLLTTVTLFAFLTAVTPVPGLAQQLARAEPANVVSPTLDPTLLQLLADHPQGGAELAALIADAIVADPKIAVGLVSYVRSSASLSSAQKLAVEQGLAEALSRLRAMNFGWGNFPWGWAAVLAALIGGGVALAITADGDDDDGKKGKVSPN